MFISRLSDRPLPFGVTNAVSLSLVIYFAGQMLNIEKKTKVNSEKSHDYKFVVKCYVVCDISVSATIYSYC